MTGICRVCGNEFEKTWSANRCLPCSLEYRREYGRIHAKELCEKQKEYAKKNKEKIKEYCKNISPEKRARNIERSRKYYQEHREAILQQQSEYGKAKRAENREKERIRKRNRYLNNPAYKIESNIRSRMKQAFNHQLTTKKDTFYKLVGCNLETLKAHLEALFLPGMTWENKSRNGWHIDHIIPCASFDLTDPKQQRACFHYTNLQPLWAKDNLKKGCKVM